MVKLVDRHNPLRPANPCPIDNPVRPTNPPPADNPLRPANPRPTGNPLRTIQVSMRTMFAKGSRRIQAR